MSLPLKGKKIVVTRAVEQADEFIAELEAAGAEVIHIPSIQIGPPDSWVPCDRAIKKLSEYSWIAFSSANGVRFFLKRLQELRKDFSCLNDKKVAVVGQKTRSILSENNIDVDLIPKEFNGEGLLASFKEKNLISKRILYITGQKRRDVLPKGLKQLGADVNEVVVYKNEPVEANHELLKISNGFCADLLTFTSPSTVRNFISLIGKEKINDWTQNGCKIASIGEITADALKKHDLRIDIMPQKSTVKNMVEAIIKFYQ